MALSESQSKRFLAATLGLLCLCAAIALYFSTRGPVSTEGGPWITEEIPADRPDEERVVFDFSGTFSSNMIDKIDNYSGTLRRGLDVDFAIVITTSQFSTPIEQLTDSIMQSWRIGKSTGGRRGLLVLLCLKEQVIRMEVGYDLEHVYTDDYVALIQDRLMKEFFEQNEVERGFYATIEHIVAQGLKKEDYLAKHPKKTTTSEFFSGGAGAKTRFRFGALLKKPKRELPKIVKKYFGAQQTPEQAFTKYVEFGYHNLSDYGVDLFSPLSKIFFRRWPTTSHQRRSESEHVMNKPYLVRTRGRHAVVLFPCNDDPWKLRSYNPYFFVKGKDGWQADMNAMARSIMMTGYNHWFFISFLHPYMFAFQDYLIDNNTYMFKRKGQKAYIGILYNRRKKDKRGLVIFPAMKSTAEKGGIKKNDVLLSIDGQRITRPYQDWEMMKNYSPGDVVEVKVIRDDRELSIPITLAKPENIRHRYIKRAFGGNKRPGLGLYFGYSLPYERKKIDSYVSILEVASGSPADKAGLKPNDYVIGLTGARRKYITLGDVTRLLYEMRVGDKIEFIVLRNLRDKITRVVVVENIEFDGFY